MSPLLIVNKHKTGHQVSHRETLWLQQYKRCHYCNRMTDLDLDKQADAYGYTATIEHVVPRSRGGQNAIENKVISCDRCNCLRNMIEQRLQGHGKWSDINVPVDLFIACLPVDFSRWSVYNRGRLDAVIETMRRGQ